MSSPQSFRNIDNISTSDLWLASNVARQSLPADRSRWFNLSNFFFDDTFEGTPGSVLFIGTDGRITEDNSNLYYDDTNDRLGINTGTSPSANLHVNGTVRFQNLSGTGTGLAIDSDGYITRTTAYTGTVTSVAASVPTGFSISGSPITTSGTLAISNSFTSGSVVFAMGTGFAQDNSNFYWDDTNNRLGIGTASPLTRVHIKNPGTGTTITALYAETSASANILQVATDSAATFALLGSTSFTENTFRVNGPTTPAFTGVSYQITGTEKFRSGIRSDNNFQFAAVDGGGLNIGGFHIVTATGGLKFKEKLYEYNATAPTNGQLLIGHTANGSFELASLTAGSGVTITPGAGSISISATGLGGTVTDFSAGDLSPLFTTSEATTTTTPALTFTLSNAAAHTWFGNATAGSTTPSYNAFGTGVDTWLTTPSSANLATAVTDETGSGALVFGTSPTLTTPDIGVATATSVANSTAANSKITFASTGLQFVRNVADSNTLAEFNQANAGSTGKLLDVQLNGTTKFQVQYTGSTVVFKDSNDATHAFKVSQNHASATGTIITGANSGGDVFYLSRAGKFSLYAGSAPTNGQMLIGHTANGTFEIGTITVGTTGTDFAVATGAGTLALNLPDAGASARGAVTTGTQTLAGAKTLSSGLTISASGSSALIVGNTTAAFRTSNGGSNIAMHAIFDVDNSSSTAGAQAFGFETATGFVFTAANGTRRIARAAMKLSNSDNTAGSEDSDLLIYTMAAGTLAERFRITNTGNIYGTALHNNATSPTGTTTQYIASGTYTPTRSAEANTDSNVTVTTARWTRVGNVVSVSGRFTANPTTTSTATSFELTLPIASNIAAVADLNGVAVCGNIASMSAEIIGVVANDTAKVQWVSTDVTSQTWSYHFQYEIL